MLHLFAHPLASCCATTPNMSFVPLLPKHSTTTLHPFAQLLQQCWDHACTLHMVSKVLWLVSFPQIIHCRSTNCWELLHLFAHHCDYRPNTSQHCWPTNVGSCCICLHTTMTADPTTPNIGPPMLAVILSVCM